MVFILTKRWKAGPTLLSQDFCHTQFTICSKITVVVVRLRSAEENGFVASSVRRGPSPEVIAPPPATETPTKPACVSEDSATPTQPRAPGKSKQQLDIRAELEKRQGGKPLLNLVVIGTTSPSLSSCFVMLYVYWCFVFSLRSCRCWEKHSNGSCVISAGKR